MRSPRLGSPLSQITEENENTRTKVTAKKPGDPINHNEIEFHLEHISNFEIDENDVFSVATEKIKHKRIFSKHVVDRTSKIRDETELNNRSSIIIKKNVI